MSIFQLLDDPQWDSPIYKVLAANDTASAPGHQGGMVIPVSLRTYFPNLSGSISEIHPTIDHMINALLYIGHQEVDRVVTRYQLQTWGGTRSETRLTHNLGSLRNIAAADDYLIIQRNLNEPNLFRLILVRQELPEYQEIKTIIGESRSGVLGVVEPIRDDAFLAAKQEELNRESEEFQLFDDSAQLIVGRTIRIARNSAFKSIVLEAYQYSCAITGDSIHTPSGLYELEAAHIIPKSRLGCDDVRNGMALSRRLHWAFDHGLFSIDENRLVFVPEHIRNIPSNMPISEFHGTPIREPQNINQRADQDAIDWHRENILLKPE